MDDKLNDALEIVSKAIDEYKAKLEAINNSDTDSNDPIMIEGETNAGYYCQLMVNPKEIAPTLLAYKYYNCRVLKQEAPDAMWEELAAHFGLYKVTSFDL